MTGRRNPPDVRFWEKVEKGPGCWVWTGSVGDHGYGQLMMPGGAPVLVHRFSYELHIGPIPDGLFVCHSCDNKRCVRPDHFFLGTAADNLHDALHKGVHIGPVRKTTCIHGHSLSIYKQRQVCWTCERERTRRYRAERRAQRTA